MDTSHSLASRELAHAAGDSALAGRSGLLNRLGLLLALALMLWAGVALLIPPAVVPASAPASAFSAERAMAELRVIAAAPRPAGSAGHAATRQYLVDQLSALGLKPEIQATLTHNRFPGTPTFSAGPVQNVVVRIPGSASSGVILIDAHYDGPHTGPGAADCGACVVSAIETLRALLAGPPLKNDLIVVFSDAEENVDLGAHAFATQHPWARDVRLALNFEAQGSGGPALLYVTSPQNSWLVGEYLKAVPHPSASSYMVGLMALLASQRLGCDLEEYMDLGSAGLGFYFGNDTPAYHTVRDNVEVIDPRSIQQMGANTLALVRHFGVLDLRAMPREQSAVFFNLLPDLAVSYPLSWVLPLNLLISLAVLLSIGYGLWRGRVGLGRTLLGALALLLFIPLGVALVALLWAAIWTLNPGYQVMLIGTYQSTLYTVAFICVLLALLAALVILLRTRLTPLGLASGGLLLGLLLLWLVSLALPAASYVLAWPLLFGLLPVAAALVAPERAERPWLSLTLLALAALPGLILLPTILYINVTLLNRFEGMFGMPLLGLIVLFVAPQALLLTPQIVFLSPVGGRALWRWLPPVGALLLGLILIGRASLSSGYSPALPRPDRIGYVLDADSGTAQWVSPDQQLDSYTSQFIPPGTQPAEVASAGYVGYIPRPAYTAPAPLVALAAPEVALLSDQSAAGVRTLQLHITSPRGADQVELKLETGGVIVAASLNGQPLDLSAYAQAQTGTLNLSYVKDSGQGFDLTLAVRDAGAVVLTLADISDGLPQIPGFTTPARPADTMPAMGLLADPTVVMRSYRY
jgi:hypothetical protein